MSDMKERILARIEDFESGPGKTRRKLVDETVGDLMLRLEGSGDYSRLDLDGAAGFARERLSEKLLARLDESADDRARRAALRMAFKACLPPLRLTAPLPVTRLVPGAVASAGLVGGGIGLAVLGGLARLVLGDPTIGLVLGGPLGAWAFLRLILFLENRPKVRRGVQVALGAATFAEIFLMFRSPFSLFGGIPNFKLGRIGAYVAAFLFITFAKRERVAPWTEVRQGLEVGVEAWLDGAVRLLDALEADDAPQLPAESDREAMAQLGERLQLLRGSSGERLPLAVEDVLNAAEEAGFELMAPGDDPTAWSDDLTRDYDKFGEIEPGDAILIERRPVVRDGEVVRRGLARRDRGKR